MKTFRTLELAIQYYQTIENIKLPAHLRNQILRAASSVSLNLSEGNAKRSYADKKRIYQIALGSFRESQTILKLAKYENAELAAFADHLGACLYKLTTFKNPGN
ncbi:MAG: four helix bundle protein [Deltaproteobacteria bacterium]|nr:four helix bundle protein [Deltaproteobacteria bacterium]